MSESLARRSVAQLKRAGLRPSEALVKEILSFGETAVQPLLELATDRELLSGTGEDLLGPLHALRLLGELRSPVIVRPLLEMYPLDEGNLNFGERVLSIWSDEVPQIIARIGPDVAPELWAVAGDAESDGWRRFVALQAVAHLAAMHTELRDETVARLRTMLAEDPEPAAVSGAVRGLATLRVAEAYPEVMAAYREKRADTSFFTAAVARQLLLSKHPAGEPLSCAEHPLWERYNAHGPAAADLQPQR